MSELRFTLSSFKAALRLQQNWPIRRHILVNLSTCFKKKFKLFVTVFDGAEHDLMIRRAAQRVLTS